MTSKTPKVVVFGSINADRSITVDRLPVKGETLSGSGGIVSVGGKGANSAVAASKLGSKVSFIVCVGAKL